jgi:hypothetical protein
MKGETKEVFGHENKNIMPKRRTEINMGTTG